MNEKNGFRFAYALQKSDKQEEAEIMVYSEIVQWKWRRDDPEVTAAEFDKLLKEAKASGAKKLRLRINSPGGSVWQAVAMKTMLAMSDFEEIKVDIEGLCASAATFFVCVPGAHVRIADGSEFMIHNPYTYTGGTASEILKTADRLRKLENEQHTMYAARSGQTEEQIKSWMDSETWFTAKEAVDAGFADEIIATTDAAACASDAEIGLMKEIYACVPDSIRESAKSAEEPVRTAETQVASEPASENITTHKEENNLEISELTAQQIQSDRPDLHNEIFNAGVLAERERMAEIDALTDEGFEELAQTAKENGTTAADFLKQIVAQRGKKKKEFLANRANETTPAQEVTGGASTDNDGVNEDDEIEKNAKEMAEMAKGIRSQLDGSMF